MSRLPRLYLTEAEERNWERKIKEQSNRYLEACKELEHVTEGATSSKPQTGLFKVGDAKALVIRLTQLWKQQKV